MASQNDLDSINGLLQSGQISSAEANIRLVECAGFKLVTKLPKQIRDALNQAVKEGRLCHIKKDGMKPEVYFHRNGRGSAIEARNRAERASLSAISAVCAAGL